MVAGNSNSNNDIGALVGRILRWQVRVGLVVAGIAGLVWGRAAGFSALAGGAIGVIANLYMARKVLRPVSSAGSALGQLYMGQLVKVAITVGLFVAASRVRGLFWPALLIAYLATVVVFWWVPYVGNGSVGGKVRE